MADADLPRATYADLCAVPDHLIAELIDGGLVTQPRPRPRHAVLVSRLMAHLGGPFDVGAGGPGGWRIIFEPEIHVDAQVIVPDLAGWRVERLRELPQTAWFDSVPDWVCEVLSPGTLRRDRGRKADIYAEWGVGWYWIIDPEAGTLEIFELRERRWLRFAAFSGEEAVVAPPFDAVPLGLARLWEE
ncbi:MAG: Uma2 family endonuclease [Neomegalonema sp.]|nr:Uma2 family endonuclease [Neomegalonema sp.]